MISTLLLAALPMLQTPASDAGALWPLANTTQATTAPAQPLQAAPQPNAAADLDILLGAIGAPQQPTGRSTARFERTPRVNYELSRGRTSNMRVRVRDLANVRGQELNEVHGIGLVTGLAGTGDSGNAARIQLANLLKTVDLNLTASQLASNNISIVWVEASLPPGVKPGRRVDARVSSIYDAESLVGGNLVWCELLDPTGTTVYATASGPVSVGGFSAEGDGATVSRNHLTVGLVPQGCKVERPVATQLTTEQGLVYLDLRPKTGGFGNSVRIADAINTIYGSAAMPVDAMTVRVEPPSALDAGDTVRFVSSLLALELEPEASARIVINARTGVIVLGEQVRIGRGAITKGNLTVTIAETPEVSQPAPLSNGETEVLPRTDLSVEEENRALALVDGAANLAEVVEVLNVLGVTPRDMIDILQAMAQSGMLHGELVIQ